MLNFSIILDPVQKVCLASSNLANSLKYWSELLGMEVFEKQSSSAVLGFSATQPKLELKDIGKHLALVLLFNT